MSKQSNFKEAVQNERMEPRGIPENDYSSSRTRFAAVMKALQNTEEMNYQRLFVLCAGLIYEMNTAEFNSGLITGVRVKIYQGDSWEQKDWRWYGIRSFELAKENDITTDCFNLLPWNSLSGDVFAELWKTTDRWEIELYATTGEVTGDDCLSSTLAFYSYGPVVEFHTTDDNIGKHMRSRIEGSLARREDVDVYLGLAAMNVARKEMVENTKTD